MKQIVLISDTHLHHEKLIVPPCEILIHCGDISNRGSRMDDIDNLNEYKKFNEWIGKQNAKYKIVIGGNHDYYLEKIGKEASQKLLNNCIYLCNDYTIIDNLKIYGSPTSKGCSNNKAFQSDHFMNEFYKDSDKNLDIDILLTHGPVSKDFVKKYNNLKLYSWGHFHAEYGIYKKKSGLIEVCACSSNPNYDRLNLPIVINYN